MLKDKDLFLSTRKIIYKIIRLPQRVFATLKNALSLLNSHRDFWVYRNAIQPYRKLIDTMPAPDQGGLLIVSGRGMNIMYAQIWTLLSLSGRINKLKPYVLSFRKDHYLNQYFRLMGIEILDLESYLEDVDVPLPLDFRNRLSRSQTFEDIRALNIDRVPIGDIALSTYCRYYGSGLVDVTQDSVRSFLLSWIEKIWRSMHAARTIYSCYGIRASFHTEIFMEEYGGFYYEAINIGIRVIKFAPTVRDNAFIVRSQTLENDRLHHASLSDKTWEKIRNIPLTNDIQCLLSQNFDDRYGEKWHRSKRNYRACTINDAEIARSSLNLPTGRKVAVIYSHILYDTIFFFGTDLFRDYTTWLIETIREAISNDKLEWYIKIHPSNIWRGDLAYINGGKYLEETLVKDCFGTLPSHVHLIGVENPISPLAWMKLADFGITVRGTSGLEMAALGKTVITAGTGRYEKRGFTYDPQTQEEYRTLLRKLPDLANINGEATELAIRYAYGIFILKPFTFSSLEPRLRHGCKTVVASDDLIYIPRKLSSDSVNIDLNKLAYFLQDDSSDELISS
jgi:hypothetical protein